MVYTKMTCESCSVISSTGVLVPPENPDEQARSTTPKAQSSILSNHAISWLVKMASAHTSCTSSGELLDKVAPGRSVYDIMIERDF